MSELWSTTARNKYIPAPGFGHLTGMSRGRFESLWSCTIYSEECTDPAVSSKRRRWSLVDDFVTSFNAHRAAHVRPSDLLCVDESMSKWYGQGRGWSDRGVTMYVAIDRKPENGCEIQNTACGRSGIMLCLQLVTTVGDQRQRFTSTESLLLHGTVVLKRLVSNLAGMDRVACGDSYFASVKAALELRSMGLRFVGVVKNSTTQYPMPALSTLEVPSRGSSASLYHRDADGQIDPMAAMWVNRDRRYFISTTSTCLDGAPIERLRWRTGAKESERVPLTIRQPQVAEVYYQSCAQIDRLNRCRQDDLRLEHKCGTHDWSTRVNMSILGMCVVDSWILYAGARGPLGRETQAQFYEDLEADLIENRFDSTGLRDRAVSGSAAGPPEVASSYGVGTHLTLTLKRRKLIDSSKSAFLAQRNCRVCRTRQTNLVCSTCRECGGEEVFLCAPREGRQCFSQHLRATHNLVVQ